MKYNISRWVLDNETYTILVIDGSDETARAYFGEGSEPIFISSGEATVHSLAIFAKDMAREMTQITPKFVANGVGRKVTWDVSLENESQHHCIVL